MKRGKAMRTPAFWYHKRLSFLAHLLSPLGRLYWFMTAKRLAKGAQVTANVPVICVGNATAGGNGKTPLTIELLMRLAQMGHRPVALSKAHGAKVKKPMVVDPSQHKSTDVGDEALLLAQFGRVVVTPSRPEGARLAQELGSIIIMDDGFQDPSLTIDHAILVVDAAKGFGNGLGIPAGPLREPPQVAMARADQLIVLGGKSQIDNFMTSENPPGHLAQSTGYLDVLPTGIEWSGQKVVAFAGIASPQRFYKTLHSLGANVILFEALGDHAPIPAPLLRRLREYALAHDAQIVTTEKDAARLGMADMQGILTLPVRLKWYDDKALQAMVHSLDKLA